MADAAVTVVLEKLSTLLIQEAILLFGERDQVEWIKREMERMKAFLKDAEEKQLRNERVKNWVQETRDVAHEAEDTIDTYILKTRDFKRRGLIGFTKRYAFFFKKLIARHKFCKEIEGIKLKIEMISQSRKTYDIGSIDEGEETSSAGANKRLRQQTSPLLSEVVIGLEIDTERLVARLVEQQARRCVISIVGMGGLGKTTLAKKVYNNSDVKTHFECRAWVSISQYYKIDEILLDIAKDAMGITKDESRNMNKRDLEEKLHDLMNEKKYLVVLDDLWSKEAWDDIKSSLPDGINGSRVLLTTRFEDVARYADSESSFHTLPFLNKDESWELLFKKVFPTENDVTNCPPELEAEGKEIAAKCGGLRLAIVVTGGLLSTKEKSESEWSKVRRTINQQLNEGEGQQQCIEMLALSYNDLPHNLKSCFLYLGLLPKNYSISVKELMRLWVGEGFVQPLRGETLEEAAEYQLKELIQRSMIQADRKFDGRVKTCYIHDLMRDFAIKKGNEGSFLEIYGDVDTSSPTATSARRLAVHGNINNGISVKHSTLHLRTLLCFPKYTEFLDEEQSRYILKNLKLLRVLDLAYVNAAMPWTGLHKFIFLRYLKLMSIEMLFPPPLSSNWLFPPNIQTLDISTLKGITIPNFIWRMKELRHLYVDSHARIEPPERADDISLENLRTLKTIGGDSWRLEYLFRLISLTKLAIEAEKLERVEEEEALSENLGSMLSLSWNAENTEFPNLIDTSHLTMMLECCLNLRKLKLNGALTKLPDSRKFPPQLVKLYLFDNYLGEDPMVLLQKLPNLQILHLHNSNEGEEMVCSAGGFPRLLYLTITCHWKLREWRVDAGAMPSLKYLRIVACIQLQMLPVGLKGLTNLTQLTIDSPRLVKDEGFDWDRIKLTIDGGD